MLWGHCGLLVILYYNVIRVEVGGHKLVSCNIVFIFILISICFDVADNFFIRGNFIGPEKVDHDIICALTSLFQSFQVYLHILVEVLNVGVGSGHVCVQAGEIFSKASCYSA